MRISEDVLRYMSIRVNELEEGPSTMMRHRDREDRPRRNREDRNESENETGTTEGLTKSTETSIKSDETLGEEKA